MGRPYGSGAYSSARVNLLRSSPICVHCGRSVATEADHSPPLSLHDHVEGTGCCVLLPSCASCARSQGAEIRNRGIAPRSVEQVIHEPEGFPVDSDVWAVPWLESLRAVPENATWPRLMTVPHPDAVDSLGRDVARWALERRGRPWRWWQELMATRLLEIDADGRLVWEVAILSLARQLGKTWWLADVCAWRSETDRFDVEQTVLSTGKDVAVCREMQRPARVRAKQRKGEYKVREVNGQEEIERLRDPSSRWMVRAKESVYGVSATMATVDEGWKVPASCVDDGIIPTMVEQEQTQLLLVSTAHRRASALMIGRRATAFDDLSTGRGSLLVEWSAPPDSALDDRRAWRQASPHWTAKRERWIAERLTAAQSGESDDADEPDPISAFRCQWLNQWPSKRVLPTKGERLLDVDEWASKTMTLVPEGGRIWIAVEDFFGQGAAVAAAVQLDVDLVGLDGWLCDSWEEAMNDVRALIASHERYRLFVGATMSKRVPSNLTFRTCGSAETRTGLSTLRDLVRNDRLVHDDSPELDAQIASCRVTQAVVGLMIVAGSRTDLVRAASWAVQGASKPVRIPSIA